jgi:hypothetical protein
VVNVIIYKAVRSVALISMNRLEQINSPPYNNHIEFTSKQKGSKRLFKAFLFGVS